MVAFSLEELKERYPVEIRWRSYELRPAGSPPLPDWYRQRIEAARPQFTARMKEMHQVEINSGPFGINSRFALIGAKFAAANGAGEAYHQAAFAAYWQHGQAIDDWQVLADIAERVGLDRTQFLQALAADEWETAVATDIDQAFAFGLSSVPSLVFSQKYLVVGAQPTSVLAQVIDRIRSESEPTAGADDLPPAATARSG